MTEDSQSVSRPLCVDLDGTLVKTDTFAQALLLLIRRRPAMLFKIPSWLKGGMASLKSRIAQEVELDPAALPYHPELLSFLTAEHARGRELILATASDETVARRIADHLGIFSGVIASDGKTNLKSARKRDALIALFGENKFDYAGNSMADAPVWQAASGVIAVNPDASARSELKGKTAQIFEDRPATWKAWLRAMRIQQWVKNSLIFLPMLLAHELTRPMLYLQATVAFIAFGLLASAIYIVNDLMDLHADQHHPRKKTRPFAAGDLTLGTAILVAPVLIVSALLLAQCLPPAFSVILLIYLFVTTAYSWRLKQFALLDVITLAGLFTIRILAGTAAYGVETSVWLLEFSIFIFFSLALVKRYAELREALAAHPEKIGARGRGYHARHMPWLLRAGIVSGILATVVLAFYITSEKVVQFYNTPHALWLLCPLVLYWIARIWRLAANGNLSDDPLEFAARDRQTWVIGLLGVFILIWGSL